jgi:DNA-binding transcriptional LysR family regulator
VCRRGRSRGERCPGSSVRQTEGPRHDRYRPALRGARCGPLSAALSEREPDLLDEGYDVALVLAGELSDSGLISQRLGSTFSIACASPAYLERHGVPRTPAELVAHSCLHTVTPIFPAHEWVFHGPRGWETFAPGTAKLCVNVAEALAVAVGESMGIGLLPFYSAAHGLRSGELVRVLPEYTSQHTNVYALYPSRQYLDAKIRTWVEFLREELPATLNHECLDAVAANDLPY